MTNEHISIILGTAGFLVGLHFASAIVLAFVIGFLCHAALHGLARSRAETA
jgi:hypothetical protein